MLSVSRGVICYTPNIIDSLSVCVCVRVRFFFRLYFVVYHKGGGTTVRGFIPTVVYPVHDRENLSFRFCKGRAERTLLSPYSSGNMRSSCDGAESPTLRLGVFLGTGGAGGDTCGGRGVQGGGVLPVRAESGAGAADGGRGGNVGEGGGCGGAGGGRGTSRNGKCIFFFFFF